MKRLLMSTVLAVGLFGLGTVSRADTLLNLTNPAGQSDTPFTLSFIATNASTTLLVEGYQIPAFENLTNNTVNQLGYLANLLSQTWSFTPASSGSDTEQYDDGSSVNALDFGGVTVGSYDQYAQNFSTVVGSEYNYSFLYENDPGYPFSEESEPSSLIVSANATPISAAPEPSTWALMIAGVGLAGGALRRRPQRRWSVTAA